MGKGITWVGLEAHKKAINVAVLVGHERQPQEWNVEHKPAAIRRLVKKVVRDAEGGEVRCCYEAGRGGYALQRQIEAAGPVICEVIAPALIPRKPGERIKTDRRDARKLAELLRAGLLTEVRAPTPEQEAVRDLCRAREDAKEDLLRCRHRLGKMLLRRGDWGTAAARRRGRRRIASGCGA
jgi:transposase